MEFTYQGLSIYTLPEIVFDRKDMIEIINWKTGKSGFRNPKHHRLKAGGLTCWARSVLKERHRPVTVKEVYLRGPAVFEEVFDWAVGIDAIIEEIKKVVEV